MGTVRTVTHPALPGWEFVDRGNAIAVIKPGWGGAIISDGEDANGVEGEALFMILTQLLRTKPKKSRKVKRDWNTRDPYS